MKRKIFLDGGRYAQCEVDNYGDTDVYLFDSSVDLKEVCNAMQANGLCVKAIHDEDSAVVVDRTKFLFKGDTYTLNQCSDLFDWFGESQAYDFTYYYDRVVFHTPNDYFYAAYRDNLDNYVRI